MIFLHLQFDSFFETPRFLPFLLQLSYYEGKASQWKRKSEIAREAPSWLLAVEEENLQSQPLENGHVSSDNEVAPKQEVGRYLMVRIDLKRPFKTVNSFCLYSLQYLNI